MSYNLRRDRLTTSDAPAPLSMLFRERTQGLHGRAERSGIVRDLLRGGGTREGYALLLRNLLPAYRAMEYGLERHSRSPLLGGIARPEVYRSAALLSDLETLCGPDWAERLPLLPGGERYARRAAAAADGDGAPLLAHAYVRYLGDLSGGQVLKRLLSRSLGLEPEALGFYTFSGIVNAEQFKEDYRASIDSVDPPVVGAVVEEAAAVFELNIAVSEEVGRFAFAKA